MSRLYTVDNKLLVDTPEIRIGEKIYPVDDRQKTVKKIMKLLDGKDGENKGQIELVDKVFILALGEKNAKEIDDMNLPFAAQQSVFENLLAAITGEEPKDIDARFQDGKKNN
jgi:hypothetical protein